MPTNQQSTITDLIGSKESAALLFIDRATCNRWAASGRLPVAVTAPGATGPRLFHRADVEALARTLANAALVTATANVERLAAKRSAA